MNAVEIEEAVSKLAEAPFDPEEFSFAFLEAFGNKSTTLKRLKSGHTNKSDLPSGVLQRDKIHLKVCLEGEVTTTLTALRESSATARQKAKFILATDGKSFEAENLADGETVACNYPDFHDHFGFFLPLAGITTVKQIRENAFDIKATGRLNRLYIELLRDNPDWDKTDRREELNHFMARLIFCFFAEDTNIFCRDGLFTEIVAQMSASDASNTHEVISELFRAMCTPLQEREAAGIRNWVNVFPYVNGGLFSPHPLTPSPKLGEGEQDPAPLSQVGRGAGVEGLQSGEGEQEGEYWEISPTLKKKMTEVARQFRKEPTPSENILWQALRGRKLEGRKFRRQQPIGSFVVDFFCGAERLIVELDGGVHDSQQAADRQRQELLESLGLRVVRVPSKLVETGLDEALAIVRQAFSPHPLTPSPKTGEGGQEAIVPLSQAGRGAGGEGLQSKNHPHPLTPSPVLGEGGQDPAPLSQLGRGAGGEGLRIEVPRFSKIARSYLLHVGNLDWKKINPDIFGSMIQAVADDEERGALGMHYTSVPNILKVLNPLFLDDLRAQLEAAGDNARKLLNLRQRMARIRVFDPACGSGNFLVIAYKEMRNLEAEINRRRNEANRRSEIPPTNFRGIEIRHFSAEIARLALVIAEYQCNVLYLGQQEARSMFLPLQKENWITCGNALRLNWLSLCPPTGTGVKLYANDLFSTPLDQAEIDFENEGGETYVCGNPPYSGKGKLTAEQQSDMKFVFEGRTKHWGYIDLVGAWFVKASDFCLSTDAAAALVSTNSVVMGRQAPTLWPIVLANGIEIRFSHGSFLWSNNAANKAAVFCVIVGIDRHKSRDCQLFEDGIVRHVEHISHYLTAGTAPLVKAMGDPISQHLPHMILGNKPNDGKALRLTFSERLEVLSENPSGSKFIRRFYGSDEYNKDIPRYCLWISDELLASAEQIESIRQRLQLCRETRLEHSDDSNKKLAQRPHQMREFNEAQHYSFIVPAMTAESREYIPCGSVTNGAIISSQAFTIFDADLWTLSLLLSKLHFIWIATICGKFKKDYRYSNDLGWNTFPVPTLTDQNKTELTRCAEDILLAREAHFPATIADLYDPETMPENLRQAHDRNDEVLERIYIGRRFKNDTERLEKLFELYTKMTTQQTLPLKSVKGKTNRSNP
jgi:very-short-patch-repair endonuclease